MCSSGSLWWINCSSFHFSSSTKHIFSSWRTTTISWSKKCRRRCVWIRTSKLFVSSWFLFTVIIKTLTRVISWFWTSTLFLSRKKLWAGFKSKIKIKMLSSKLIAPFSSWMFLCWMKVTDQQGSSLDIKSRMWNLILYLLQASKTTHIIIIITISSWYTLLFKIKSWLR